MLELIVSPTSYNLVKNCEFCDAFILGEEQYSLRLAHYFSFEEIVDLIDICKNRQQKIYIAVNKIVHEAELNKIDKYLSELSKLNIDGIIFGDLGVYNLARKYKLENKLIYNPETYVTNYESTRFFAKKGIKRVSIAKEITLEDILLIGSKEIIEIDILGHGAVNMFHSMRDLVTNYFKFLKSNKTDKHTNEQLYLIEEIRDGKYPILEDQNGTHVFSEKDLCTINYLDMFIENHVSGIRIDGLFKKDEELLNIIKIYRKAISDYQVNKQVYVNKKTNYLENLEKIENIRPFYEGFLFKKTIYKGGENEKK